MQFPLLLLVVLQLFVFGFGFRTSQSLSRSPLALPTNNDQIRKNRSKLLNLQVSNYPNDASSINDAIKSGLGGYVSKALLPAMTGLLITFGAISGKNSYLRANAKSQFPILGSEDLMKPKQHGSSSSPVQSKLKWGCDVQLADRICNYNRRWAENAGYFMYSSPFLSEISKEISSDSETVHEITFFDSVTGKPLFIAPRGRSFNDWVKESKVHGWPSFRDEGIILELVLLSSLHLYNLFQYS